MVYVIYNFGEIILGRCVPNVWSSYVFIYVDANNKTSFIFVCNGFMLD